MLGDQPRAYDRYIPPFLFVLGLLIFTPFLGSVHLFDWDEINFAEAAREMIVTGDYLRVHIDYEPFWEKPPLFLWMQTCAMHVFGINEFAARFPNALCGALTLPILFFFGKRIHGRSVAMLWPMMYVGSFLPHFYFKTGIIDPWFNLFIVLGVLLPALPEIKDRFVLSAGLSGFCIGLAILTKGPVGYIMSAGTFGVLALMDVFKKKDGLIFLKHISWIALMTIFGVCTASLWFGIEVVQNGTWFIEEFIRYQIRLFSTGDAGHSGPFYYHAVILLIGCFPASLFALSSLFKQSEKPLATRLMLILFWLTLILFSIVKTKIIHYSSLCYLPLTFMAALSVKEMVESRKVSRKILVSLAIGITVWTAMLLIVPLIGLNVSSILPKIRDEFARMNLTAPVTWTGFELFIGVLYSSIGIFALICIQKQHLIERGMGLLSFSTIISLMLFLPIIAPKIEGYTQAAPIAFYQSLKGKDVLIYPSGYKSYAHLFYAEKLPPTDYPNSVRHTDEELMNGASKKPVFFIAKIKRAKEMMLDSRVIPVKDLHGFKVFRVQSISEIPK